jgi:hypothetical protein
VQWHRLRPGRVLQTLWESIRIGHELSFADRLLMGFRTREIRTRASRITDPSPDISRPSVYRTNENGLESPTPNGSRAAKGFDRNYFANFDDGAGRSLGTIGVLKAFALRLTNIPLNPPSN